MNETIVLIVLALLLIGLAPLFIMWLWNLFIPGVTGFTEISYWQALGLFILSNILTGVKTSKN